MERSLVEQTIPRGHPNYVFLHKLLMGKIKKTCKNKFVHQIFDGWDMLIQATKTIRELNRRLITKIGLDINQVASFEDLINIEKYAFKDEEFHCIIFVLPISFVINAFASNARSIRSNSLSWKSFVNAKR